MRSLLALADLIVDPSRINDLTPDEARAILAQLATLQAPLLAKALATPVAEEKDSANALLLVPDAAARLGIEASYLYELIRQGRVPAVRLGPKYVRVHPTIVAAIQEKGLDAALGSTYSPRRDRRRAAPHPKAPRAHAGSAG